MDVKEMPALGRHFKLGQLYDYRTHKLIENLVWDETTIDSQTVIQPQPLCDFEFTAEDTLSAKTSFLNVKGDLKLKLFWGLVEVNGSAQYLKNHRKYTRQSRVSVKYKRRTIFKELQIKKNMPDLQIHQRELISTTATHVVTGIMYGIDTILVFDRNSAVEEDQQRNHKELETMLRFLPTFSTGQQANTFDLFGKKIKCTYFSDVDELNGKSASFEEAISDYKRLPTIIEQKVEASVPMIVWLYPLDKISSKILTLHRPIDETLVNQIQNILEDFKVFYRKCNDLLESPTCIQYPVYMQEVVDMQKTIQESEFGLQNQLRQIINNVTPIDLVRRQVRKLLDVFDKSLESPMNLDNKISEMSTIINVLNVCVRKTQSSNKVDDTEFSISRDDGQFKLPAIEEFYEHLDDSYSTANERKQRTKITREKILGMRKTMQKNIESFNSKFSTKEKSHVDQGIVQHAYETASSIPEEQDKPSFKLICRHTLCRHTFKLISSVQEDVSRALRKKMQLSFSGKLLEDIAMFISNSSRTLKVEIDDNTTILLKGGELSIMQKHKQTTTETMFQDPHFLQFLLSQFFEFVYKERTRTIRSTPFPISKADYESKKVSDQGFECSIDKILELLQSEDLPPISRMRKPLPEILEIFQSISIKTQRKQVDQAYAQPVDETVDLDSDFVTNSNSEFDF